MCQAEPATEMFRRFIGRAAVEGHQRTRSAGGFGDLRAPLVHPDGRNLDAVRPAVDDLLEMMHGHVCLGERGETLVEPRCILAPRQRVRKRKDHRRRTHMQQRPGIGAEREKIFYVVTECPQRFHVPSTCFPQPFFARRLLALALAPRVVASAQAAPPEATLFRVFLVDGTTLVSYGEYARVADRVVLSLPLGGTPAAPRLQLLSIPATSVDWDRTDAYADAARAARFAATRGPDEYALLQQAVARALSDIAVTTDADRKLAMAVEARQNVTGGRRNISPIAPRTWRSSPACSTMSSPRCARRRARATPTWRSWRYRCASGRTVDERRPICRRVRKRGSRGGADDRSQRSDVIAAGHQRQPDRSQRRPGLDGVAQGAGVACARRRRAHREELFACSRPTWFALPIDSPGRPTSKGC